MMMVVVNAVGVVGRMVIIFIVFLFLLSGAGQRLQEHLLGRDRAECHKTSSGTKRTQKNIMGLLQQPEFVFSAIINNWKLCEEIKSLIFTEQIQHCALGMTGIWRCIGFLVEERKHPYAGTLERVSTRRQRNIWKQEQVTGINILG